MAEGSATYTCIKACYWKHRVWKPGDVYAGPDDEKVPRHFAKRAPAVEPDGRKDWTVKQLADYARENHGVEIDVYRTDQATAYKIVKTLDTGASQKKEPEVSEEKAKKPAAPKKAAKKK